MRRWVRKQLALLENAQLPFAYTLSFTKEVERDGVVALQETATYEDGETMFVNIVVAKEHCKALRSDYEQQIFFQFPADYPFSPPFISLEEPMFHSAVNQRGQIIINGYAPAVIDIAQLICNAYFVICEALNDVRNVDVVNDWNEHCERKQRQGKPANDDDDGDA